MRYRTSPRFRPSSRLSRSQRHLVYAAALGLWLTGALWLVFHNFLMRASTFGPTPHPLEAWWLTLHGAFAFLALWSFGLIWGAHVANNWSIGRRRASGAVLIGFLGLLIGTGFLLYYVGDDALRSYTSVIHWLIGLAAPIAFFAHRFARRERRAVLPCTRPAAAVTEESLARSRRLRLSR